MDDDETYVAALLAILTNPEPSGIDRADPDGQADDGIDRCDGFGRDVRVTGLQVVDGPYGDELEVAFTLGVPDGPDWDGVPPEGATRVPFDAQWRRLNELTDPAAYAPAIAARVVWAAGDHAVRHKQGGKGERARAEWRARAKAALPDRQAQQQLLLETLAGEGEVTQVAPDRFELRRLDMEGSSDPSRLGATPDVVTFVLSPDDWEQVLIDRYDEDLDLYVAETLGVADAEERYVVFYDGHLHRSTRPELPPVRGRAGKRALARMWAENPPGPDDGWYAYDPADPERLGDPSRRFPHEP